MEKTEFVLQKTAKGVVAEKIVNPGLTVNFDEGIVQITGNKSTLSIMEKDIISGLGVDQFQIRLAEIENQAANTPAGLQTDEQKELLTKKKAIFEKLLADVKKSTETAVTALNNLYNPTT